MTYSIAGLISSVAAMLSEKWTEVPVYGSPVRQASYPCFFVFLMPSTITDQVSERWRRDISLDVVYVQERDAPNAEEALWKVAEELEELLDTVSCTDGTETVLLHTHDRGVSIEDQELHYKFRVPVRVSVQTEETLMQTLEEEDINVQG